MKKLLAVFAALCFAPAAIAADAGDAINAKNVVKSSVAAAPAVSAPVQLTNAEMDKVAAGLIFSFILIDNFGHGTAIHSTGGGTTFFRNNPANGATVFKISF